MAEQRQDDQAETLADVHPGDPAVEDLDVSEEQGEAVTRGHIKVTERNLYGSLEVQFHWDKP